MSRLMKYIKLKRKLTFVDDNGWEWVHCNIPFSKKAIKQLKKIGWKTTTIQPLI